MRKKTLGVAILGLGRIGQIHLKNLTNRAPEVEVLVAVNPSEAGRSYAKGLGVPQVTDNPGAAFDHAGVDAIFICSPNDTHIDYILRGVKAKKSIFSEKPLDLSLEKVRMTAQKIEGTRTKLMVGFNQRFDRDFAAVRQALVEGKIGDPHTLHIVSRDPSPPPIAYIERSGGLFRDMTIHDFDMARFIIGCEVTEVFARGHNLIDQEIKKAGDIDSGIVMLTFENQATAIIENSRKCIYGYDQRLEVFGSNGMIRVENPFKTNIKLYNERGRHSDRNPDFFLDRYADSYNRETDAFLDALIHGKPIPVTVNDGLQAMVIAEAANKSMNENRPVKISEI